MSDINTRLLHAALEMLRWADKGDYRPEFTAAVSRLQQAVFAAAAAHRDQQLAIQRQADQLAKEHDLRHARNNASAFSLRAELSTDQGDKAELQDIASYWAARAAIAKATGVQS